MATGGRRARLAVRTCCSIKTFMKRRPHPCGQIINEVASVAAASDLAAVDARGFNGGPAAARHAPKPGRARPGAGRIQR